MSNSQEQWLCMSDSDPNPIAKKNSISDVVVDAVVETRLEKSDLLDSKTGSLQEWIAANVWSPAVNTLVIDPHNAVTSSVNDISKSLGGREVLSDWQRSEMPEAPPLTGAWLAQNVVSGLAMVIPYGIAAVATKAGLSRLASKFGGGAAGSVMASELGLATESKLGEFLKSKTTASILGATLYDGAKKPLTGETRFGNAMGAAAGFSIFEGGNALSKGQNGLRLLISRGAVGSLGAVSHMTIAHGISTHKLPEAHQAWNAALTGAVMNNALPAFHDKLTETIEIHQWQSRLQNNTKLAFDPQMVASSQLPNYLKALSRTAATDVRSRLVEEIPHSRLFDGEHPIVQKRVKDMVRTALAHPDLVPHETLQNWIEGIPESDGSTIGNNRLALLNSLKPIELAQVIFAGSKEAKSLAGSHPNIMRSIAQEQFQTTSNDLPVAHEVLKIWEKTGTLKDLPTSTSSILDAYHDKVSFRLVQELSSRMSASDQQSLVNSSLSSIDSTLSLSGPIEMAARVATNRPDLRSEIGAHLQSRINDASLPYLRRIEIAAELARLSRQDKLLGPAAEIPDARMKPVELSPQVSSQLRASAENSLLSGDFENSPVHKQLSEIMPDVFRDANLSGSLLAEIRKHNEFADLRPKDQVNLLWVGLFSEITKESALLSSGHEMSATHIAEGVLNTLNYAPERIQRINNLLSRQSDLSLEQGSALRNSEHAREVAVALRHPAALKQLQILNQSKVKLQNGQGTLEAKDAAAFKRMNMLVSSEAMKLPPSVPIFTTPIVKGFRVCALPQDFVVVSHRSPYLSTALKQLALIESPNTALSGTLNTPANLKTHKGSPFVLLLSGAPEQIGAVARAELVSGHRKTWKDHVRLTSRPDATSWELYSELNERIQEKLKGEEQSLETPRSIRDLSSKLSEMDSLDELRSLGAKDQRVIAQRTIVEALSREAENTASLESNELTIQNPRVQGLGVIRNGRNLSLENVDAKLLEELFPQNRPSWLKPYDGNVKSNLVLEEATWRDLRKHNLPIQSMD